MQRRFKTQSPCSQLQNSPDDRCYNRLRPPASHRRSRSRRTLNRCGFNAIRLDRQDRKFITRADLLQHRTGVHVRTGSVSVIWRCSLDVRFAPERTRLDDLKRAPLGQRIHHAIQCRMLPVLDLDPVPRPPGLIRPIAMLRDQALQPHPARRIEQVGADLALLEGRSKDALRLASWVTLQCWWALSPSDPFLSCWEPYRLRCSLGISSPLCLLSYPR